MADNIRCYEVVESIRLTAVPCVEEAPDQGLVLLCSCAHAEVPSLASHRNWLRNVGGLVMRLVAGQFASTFCRGTGLANALPIPATVWISSFASLQTQTAASTICCPASAYKQPAARIQKSTTRPILACSCAWTIRATTYATLQGNEAPTVHSFLMQLQPREN